MIHAATDIEVRGRRSKDLFSRLTEPQPITGRRVVVPIFATVANGVTTIIPTKRLTGPHTLLSIRFSQDTTPLLASNAGFAISQNVLTTDAAFGADDSLGALYALDATYFPNTIAQQITFNRLMPRPFCYYKARLSNGSGVGRFYSILFELQMIGVSP